MPAALDVDFDAVKNLVLHGVGIRESARQYARECGMEEQEVTRFEETIKRRATREQWEEQRRSLESRTARALELRRVNQGLSPRVPTALDLTRRAIREGKNGWQMAAAKVGTRLGGMEAEELMLPEVSDSAGKWSKVAVAAGVLSGGGEGTMRLEILAHPVDQVEIEAEIVESPEIGIETGQDQG